MKPGIAVAVHVDWYRLFRFSLTNVSIRKFPARFAAVGVIVARAWASQGAGWCRPTFRCHHSSSLSLHRDSLNKIMPFVTIRFRVQPEAPPPQTGNGTVTGILVREILVRGTKIFSGKLVRPDRFFREKWSASGKLVRIMVRP